ncbi:hypothetical protein KCP73_13800 [Salmonella enterica subsp. enterica]|nr:hypothetical protein KCP73_13800 [Salmonella enterica subsp. enterica]
MGKDNDGELRRRHVRLREHGGDYPPGHQPKSLLLLDIHTTEGKSPGGSWN